MNDDRFAVADRYIEELFIGPDAALDAAMAESAAAGLPTIHVSPVQGSLLHLLALLVDARHILEIGTLGGYSAIWLARALPDDGRLISLEHDGVPGATEKFFTLRAPGIPVDSAGGGRATLPAATPPRRTSTARRG